MQRVNMGVIQTFARKEIKFLLTEQQYQDFLPLLNHYMNPDKFCVGGKEYGIYNIYYDTPDDFLIRESLEKPDYKEKIRLRSYLSPAQPEGTPLSRNNTSAISVQHISEKMMPISD